MSTPGSSAKTGNPGDAPKSRAHGTAAGGKGSADRRKPSRRRVSEKRASANAALTLELRGLRASLARIVEGFEVRTAGRINDLLRTLEGDESLDQPRRYLTTAQAQAALDTIAAAKLKPDKARLRDLRRIRDLVRTLRDTIPE